MRYVQMTDALTLAAGNGFRKMPAALTTNRFSGALAGMLVTAAIQSSSVTTVLVVGFISAGVMSFSQSLGGHYRGQYRHHHYGPDHCV